MDFKNFKKSLDTSIKANIELNVNADNFEEAKLFAIARELTRKKNFNSFLHSIVNSNTNFSPDDIQKYLLIKAKEVYQKVRQ